MSEPQFDIEILGQGIYVITGATMSGAWLLENVPDARVNGSEATADCEGGSMAQSIADGAIGDGLTVSALQLDALKKAGCSRIFRENTHGKDSCWIVTLVS
jgi:hypothetical protein